MGAFETLLSMGGYGAYVWPSYLLAAVVLVGLYAVSRGELRRRERRLQELEAQHGEGGRRRRREPEGDQ